MASFLSAAAFVRGQMFVNPTLFPAYDSPLINCVSLLDRVWEFLGDDGQQTFNTAGFSALDANGYPSSMPSGITVFRSYVVLYATNIPNDVWCITWDGAANAIETQPGQGSATYTTNAVSSNRLELTITSLTGNYPQNLFALMIRVTNAPISNMKIFLKSNEAAMNAGKVCNPDYVAFMKQFYGLRFMNWQNTNGSVEGDWNVRPVGNHWPNVFRGDRYNGVPTRATTGTNDFTCPTAYTGNPSSWVKGMTLLTGPIAGIIQHNGITFTTGATSTITVSGGHGLTTGAFYSFPISYIASNSYPTGEFSALFGKHYPITVVNSTTFTIAVNSSSWTDGHGPTVGMPSLRIKAGSLPYVCVVGRDLSALYSQYTNGTGESQTSEGMSQSAQTFTYDDVTGFAAAANLSGINAVPRGMSIELMVAIANECNIHPWICLPMLSGDAWDMGVINYGKANLNLGLIAHFEKGNENWNFDFTQNSICRTWAATYCPAVTDGFQKPAEVSGHISYLLHTKVTTGFAGQMNRVCRVIATWTAQPSSVYLDWQFKATNTPSANLPYTKCDYMAIAPYIEADRETCPTPKQVVDFKIGNSATKQSALASVDRMMNANSFRISGYVTSSVLTVTDVTAGSVDVGGQFWQYTQNGFTGLTAGTYVESQISGTPGGVGTYQLANGRMAAAQTVGSSGSPVNFRDAGSQTRKAVASFFIPPFKAYATSIGVALGGYEGGFGVYPQYSNYAVRGAGDAGGGTTYMGTAYTNSDINALWVAYHESSLWGATTTALLSDWKNAGLVHWNQFQITAIAWDFGTQFGELLPGIYGDKSKPGYQASLTYNSG